MFQQTIALIVIAFFATKLYSARRIRALSGFEFFFYGAALCLVALVIFNIKRLDAILVSFGFSSSGISFLFYASVPLLAYWLFRVVIRQRQTSREITKLVRALALRDFQERL